MKTISLLLCLTTTLVAQKMPLPDGDGRILQLFDLHKLRVPSAGPERALELPGASPPATPTPEVAAMLARFVEPPLGPDDACTMLGNRWLALLGTPAQIASAERLFRLATERRERTIDIEVELVQVDDKAFVDSVQPSLVEVVRDTKVSYEKVLDAKAAKALDATFVKLAPERLQGPRLTVFPLQSGHLSIQNQTAYVKDFVLDRSGESIIADPIVDVVWDGNVTEVCATFLPDGLLGVSCDVTFQEVEKPIAVFETKVQDMPVKIQLPRVTGTHLQQTAVLATGSVVVLATRKVDGKWIVAMVRAKAQPQ